MRETPEARRAKRLAAGGMSRDRYVAESLSRSRPWDALGISRGHWYERHRWKLGSLEEARESAMEQRGSRPYGP